MTVHGNGIDEQALLCALLLENAPYTRVVNTKLIQFSIAGSTKVRLDTLSCISVAMISGAQLLADETSKCRVI